jgi:hypothetical protein
MPKVAIEMSEADFLAAQRAFYRTKLLPKLAFWFVLLFVGFVILACVAGFAMSGWQGLRDDLPLVVLAAIWSWIIWSIRWGAPIGSKRYFRQSRHRLATEYEWDEVACTMRGEDMFNRIKWRDIRRWGENRDAIALGLSARTYIPIPKRFLSPEQRESLLQHLGKT